MLKRFDRLLVGRRHNEATIEIVKPTWLTVKLAAKWRKPFLDE